MSQTELRSDGTFRNILLQNLFHYRSIQNLFIVKFWNF